MEITKVWCFRSIAFTVRFDSGKECSFYLCEEDHKLHTYHDHKLVSKTRSTSLIKLIFSQGLKWLKDTALALKSSIEKLRNTMKILERDDGVFAALGYSSAKKEAYEKEVYGLRLKNDYFKLKEIISEKELWEVA